MTATLPQSGPVGVPYASEGRRTRTLVLVPLGCLAMVVAQYFLDDSQTNIYCSIICAAATAAVIFYCFRPHLFENYPMSTFAVLGYCVTNYSLPLLAQTLNFKPLIFNLLSPTPTFNATIEFQGVIVAAHLVYTQSRTCRGSSQWLARRVLRPVWIFRYPHAGELWLLGAIGLAATWVSRILFVGSVNFGNVGGKFLQALVPYIVVPLFIPFRSLFMKGKIERLSPWMIIALVFYFAEVIVTAVAFNTRAIFAVFLLTVIIAAVLVLAMHRFKVSSRAYVFLFVGAIVAVPMVHAAQSLATAMEIARGVRGKAGPAEIMSETWRALGDSEELARYRKIELAKTTAGGYAGYSEIYLDSEFLQRLTFTKYTDLTMTASDQLTDYQRQSIRNLSKRQIISILPTPIITLFGLDVDKADLQFSTGDVYADLAFNQTPGGERSGSSITNTIDVLGALWIPISFLIFIATFILLDSYCLNLNGQLCLSTLSFVMLYQTFARGLISDSFQNLIEGMSRSYLQSVFVFIVLSFGARMVVSFFGGRTSSRRRDWDPGLRQEQPVL